MAFPARLQQLLNEGRGKIASAVKFEFGTGTYGFFSGKGSVDYGGLTYHGNTIIDIDEPMYALGTAAQPVTMRLPAAADFGLTPDKLGLIEQEDYKNRPVTFYDFYFDPDNNAFLHAEPTWYGYVDYIDHREESDEVWLEGHIETGAVDNFREGYRYASQEDQQLVSPGDMLFEYAARIKNEFFKIKFG
ncbi:hypothetical protein CN884_12130 [Ochrobactrum sp. 30A/1000/2015]|nr:hypothetical protein CN884_12130 [Ochrobactrum sp. 30A/1000/2015]PJT37579.1 hypothetical protein CN883_16545 [Ochrobactrum sp. 27A/999/2015]PJT44181.1 hypothetical protein CN882_09835 [Ochrobactrum sp. 23A/997/2015]